MIISVYVVGFDVVNCLKLNISKTRRAGTQLTDEEHRLMWLVDNAPSGEMCLSYYPPFKPGSEPQDCARYVQLKRERFEAKQSSSSGGQDLKNIKDQLVLVGEAEKYLRG